MYNFPFKLLFASVFTMMLGLAIIAPMMSLYAKSLGATGFYIGLIFSAYSLSRSILTPFFGRLSDRKGRKTFILLGLAIFAGVSILYVFGKNVPTIITLRFFQGIGSAMVIPIVMAYIGDMAPEGKEGEYMGTFTMSLFLGMGVGPILGGVITEYLGVEFVFITLCGISLINLIGLFFFLPRSKEVRKKKKKPVSLKKVFSSGVVVAVAFYRFISAVGRSSFMVFFPLLADRYNISYTWIGLIITVRLLTASLLQNPLGRLADRTNKLVLIIIGGLIGVSGFFLVPQFSSQYAFLTLSLIMGIGGGFVIPSETAIVTRIGRKGGMGLMMGVFNASMAVGIAVGPVTMGLLKEYASVDTIFYASGFIIFAGLTVFTILMLIYDEGFEYTRPYLEKSG